MRLLYVPCGHPLQEADDCLMWQKLGIDWFSTGYYSQSKKPGDLPYINHTNDKQLTKLFEKCTGCISPHDQPGSIIGRKNQIFTSYNLSNLWQFTPEFMSKFDVVFFNHHAENIKANWKALWEIPKKPRVVIKTFAMHSVVDELKIKEFRDHPSQLVWSVRNSPTEYNQYPPDKYAGQDVVIRGSVVRDEYEISGWRGRKKEVVTFSNTFNCYPARENRRRNIYIECKNKSIYPFRLFGAGNESDILSSGFVNHKEKVEILKNARVSLTTGTPGSTNTYSFVEAFIMGLPQVVYGQQLWKSPCYEPDKLGEHGKEILIGNDAEEIVKYINDVMTDDDLAHELSRNSRIKALQIYGRDTLSKQWEKFLYETIWKSRYKPPRHVQIPRKQDGVHYIRR